MVEKNHASGERFLTLYGQHQRQILGYIASLVFNCDDADDLLQQTSLVLWEKFEEFEPESDFLRWACRIANLKVMNFLRQKRRSRVFFSEALLQEMADERLDNVDSLEHRRVALRSCMKKLKAGDRELLDLCYDDCYTIKEVAEQLGRPCGSVYHSLHRIRGILFDCINATIARDER